MVLMSKSNSMLEKANAYDKVGSVKHEIEASIKLLKEFRQKYPFAENLRTIEWLDPEKLFKLNPDQTGEFFQYLEGYFKPLGYSVVTSQNVYRNARLQINSFKNLLRTAVDNRKSLAEKVDASWEKIGGIAADKILAKKIIYCFNCESGKVLPIFNNQHLRHFVNRVVDASGEQTKYFSVGQEYEFYTAELLKAKNGFPLTKGWGNLYFSRFLFENYLPPDTEPNGAMPEQRKNAGEVTDEQLNLQGFIKLLSELQRLHKITGEQFRENRELWIHQEPNDRDLTVWQLKQLLNQETKKTNAPNAQSDEPPKRPTRQKL
jgi:hypothetical protein